jgi:hypothetical protein
MRCSSTSGAQDEADRTDRWNKPESTVLVDPLGSYDPLLVRM